MFYSKESCQISICQLLFHPMFIFYKYKWLTLKIESNAKVAFYSKFITTISRSAAAKDLMSNNTFSEISYMTGCVSCSLYKISPWFANDRKHQFPLFNPALENLRSKLMWQRFTTNVSIPQSTCFTLKESSE